ncbi:MAG: hypothetical protein H6554_11860 [Chitinophagales bacterium]|nr:hypothetical protein [Chitinophagales bacterium]
MKKVSFLLLRFLWTSKENEDTQSIDLPPNLQGRYLRLIVPKTIRNFHTVLVLEFSFDRMRNFLSAINALSKSNSF